MLFRSKVEIKYNNGKKEYYFHGKRVIGRDTPINKGVYLIGGLGEALVVDDQEQPLLQQTFKDFLILIEEKAQKENRNINTFMIADALAYVQKLMPYSIMGVANVDKVHGINTDILAPLELYIRNKVGVCRHQSILLGYLLEKIKDQGYLRGDISVDRSINKSGDEYYAHAWVRYTTFDRKKVFIADPANSVIDTLQNAVRKGIWNYQRPEERVA